MKDIKEYEDIINLDYHKIKKPSNLDRAPQFSPFAALTGYEDSLEETARITTPKHELSEDKLNNINNVLNLVKSDLSLICNIIYYIDDKTKNGGEYKTIKSKIKNIDENNLIITLTNRKKIKIEDIYDIKIEE